MNQGKDVSSQKVCPRCNGRKTIMVDGPATLALNFKLFKSPLGWFRYKKMCPECKGSGSVDTSLHKS